MISVDSGLLYAVSAGVLLCGVVRMWQKGEVRSPLFAINLGLCLFAVLRVFGS